MQLGNDEFSFLTPMGIIQNDYESTATPLVGTSFVAMDGTMHQLVRTGKSYLNMGGIVIQLLPAVISTTWLRRQGGKAFGGAWLVPQWYNTRNY